MAPRRNTFFSKVQEAVSRRGIALMGVCNATPDSFSDGGNYLDFTAACAHIDALLEEGADIIDVGGESTRPGARPVSAEEQLARILGVIRYAAEKICVSVDTTNPVVAAACLDAGAVAINDVSCLADERLADVARDRDAAFILMHARGSQAQMTGFSEYPADGYGDVVKDVVAEWMRAAGRANARGLRKDALVMDPGLGFKKNEKHSITLLKRAHDIAQSVKCPVLIGASRKSFIRLADPDSTPQKRIGASVAAALYSRRAGIAIVRVHDVHVTRQALDMDHLLSQQNAGGADHA